MLRINVIEDLDEITLRFYGDQSFSMIEQKKKIIEEVSELLLPDEVVTFRGEHSIHMGWIGYGRDRVIVDEVINIVLKTLAIKRGEVTIKRGNRLRFVY